ncbi:MAG: DEAD/DEAH box helicase [Candidatus Thorarchaeota archaeon]|jgi:replicative superfamily II helicase
MSASLDISAQVYEILEGIGVQPRGIQKEAIESGLLEGQSILVCSPTGSGKTLVGEMALLRSISLGQRGLFIVPLRALANQVYEVLRERYTSRNIRVGLSTGDFQADGSDLEDYDILVTTYERTDSLLRHKSSWLEELGTVVIDEIQSLSDSGRGARLESVIIRLKESIEDLQIIGLSATIGMPDQLGDWLGCTLVESTERPIPLLCSVITRSDRESAIQQYAMTTVQRNGQVIVFQRTRREAEAEAKRLAEHVAKQLTSEERGYLQSELGSVEHWGVTLPNDLKTLLHDGIAYHHAGLGLPARRLVESFFRAGRIRVICATTTLSSGMDLPARTVIIGNPRAPLDYRKILPPNQIHQMLGRAGRPGLDNKGFGIIIADSKGQANEIKHRSFHVRKDDVTGREYLTPKYEALQSRMHDSESLQEQLLVAIDMLNESKLEEVENGFFGESYLVHQAIRDSRSPMRLIHLGEIDAASALEQHSLSDTIRAARGGVLGTVQIREVTDSVIGGIVTQRGGDNATCRFSSKSMRSGIVEGPMCSCGRPIDRHGVLCPHLVTLGMVASKENKVYADYVIPLSLGETSPSGVLTRLRFMEGADEGRVKPTRLGRLISRLYLKIRTARELLAMLPFVTDTTSLFSLLRHIVSIEGNQTLDEKFDHMIAMAASTRIHSEDMAEQLGMPVGDLLALLDRSRWLLYAITAIAREGNLTYVSKKAESLWEEIDSRFEGDKNGSD